MTFQQFKNLFTQGVFACALVMMPLQATTYTVNSTADQYPIGDSGTLRWAIQQVNMGSGGDTIVFDIPASGSGYDPATNTWTIIPVKDLDAITKQVTINGYTPSMGSSPNTLPVGSNAVLTIVLNGNNYLTGDGVTTGNGLHFLPGSDGSIVTGLVINQWLDNGILIDSGTNPVGTLSNISIVGCFIGTDASGTREMANRTGIGISGNIGTCINTSIGVLSGATPSPADRNVIAGSFGPFVVDSYGIRGGSVMSYFNVGTIVANNSIGTDKTGSFALGNSSNGIYLRGDFGSSATNNIVSGNSIFGIRLRATSNCIIEGNFVGTDSTGTQPIGNVNAGIELEDNDQGVGNCLIGNLISGNGTGIHIGQLSLPGAILNTVQANYIGTDVSGTKALPNERFGIIVTDSQNTIGGPEASQANVISGNNGGGILLYGMARATANLVANNFIGTDFTGTQPLPNKGNGIQIGLNGGLGGASGNTVGSSPLLSSMSSCALERANQFSSREDFKKQDVSESMRKSPKRRLAEESDLKIVQTPASGAVISMPQINKTMKKFLSQPSQAIGLNFTAATISNVLNPNVIAPDFSGSVGPQQYIMISHGIIRSFDKATGEPDGILDIDDSNFFGVASLNQIRITYSRFLDRWVLTSENTNESALLVVWSDTGIITPETIWTSASFSSTELAPQNSPPAFFDYPYLATDANAVYVSLDVYVISTSSFLGASTLVIPNSAIVTGNTSPAFTVFPGIISGPNGAILGGFNPPANNFDQDAEFGYILEAQNFMYPCPFTESFCTYHQLFLNRISNPGSAHPTLGQEIALDVPAYADPATAPHKGNLYLMPQGTNIMYLETPVACYLSATHVRNKQLYACHPIQLDSHGVGDPAGDRVGIRWYQFDLTGDPTGNGCGVETETTCPALVQWGTLFDNAAENPKFYYIPAIMTDKNGNLVIEGTVSGTNDYTNVFYAGRKASDPLGTLRDPVLVTNNTNPYNVGPLSSGFGQAWGDISSLAPDPSNDLAIWSTGEWAAIENGWGIQATQLLPTK